MKTIKIITVMTVEQVKQLLEEKRLDGIDNLPNIAPQLKDVIKKFVYENVGYDSAPVAGLSKYNGAPGELKLVGMRVQEVIPAKTGSCLIELHMPHDMVVSVGFNDLLDYSTMIKNTHDEEEIEILCEEFKEKLERRYDEEEDDVISFIPFVDYVRCRFYAKIDPNWDAGNLDIPGVEQVKLNTMGLF